MTEYHGTQGIIEIETPDGWVELNGALELSINQLGKMMGAIVDNVRDDLHCKYLAFSSRCSGVCVDCQHATIDKRCNYIARRDNAIEIGEAISAIAFDDIEIEDAQ